ncbi:glycosyltransferase family 4 protein [Parafrankia discariae]|uniref:glycosyltransferase family 4 protein n=1 Tax=Parafrankia discariae TaxID=365528 RepID=UPI0003A7D375|nr:glycosyltransferase family 4 protein [Parafrankia discariae]
MHVVCVHRDLHAVTRGGICTVYRQLAHALATHGHHITLITQETPHPLPAHAVTAGGGTIDVVTLPRTGYDPKALAAHSRAVTAAVNRLDPDIVECSTWEFELLDYAQTPARRAPVVVRGDLSAATMNAPILAAGEQQLLDHADAVLAVSDFAAADLHAAYGVTPEVVANGVDTARYHPRPDPGPVTGGFVVTVDRTGQVTARRPLPAAMIDDPLLAAWTAPADRPTPVRLIWVGKATTMKGWDRLEALAPRLAGRASMLVVLGHGQVHYPVTLPDHPHVRIVQDLSDDDLPALYRRADWLLSTSRWEGYGLAIAEALASGTPALLPDHLGVAPELLAAGGGATYHNYDDVLAQLARPRSGAAPSGGWLPAHMRWTINGEHTLAVYRRLLASGRRP